MKVNSRSLKVLDLDGHPGIAVPDNVVRVVKVKAPLLVKLPSRLRRRCVPSEFAFG